MTFDGYDVLLRKDSRTVYAHVMGVQRRFGEFKNRELIEAVKAHLGPEGMGARTVATIYVNHHFVDHYKTEVLGISGTDQEEYRA